MAYNVVGLTFAVSGLLTPLVAAILMPVSSLTVAVVGLSLAWLRARQAGLTVAQGQSSISPVVSGPGFPGPETPGPEPQPMTILTPAIDQRPV
jgi:hypothetical protein